MRFAWLAIVLAVVLVPALAHGEPARAPGRVDVSDFVFTDAADGDTTVVINPGETVTFADANSQYPHSVVFDGNAPTSCTGLPPDPINGPWQGACTFNTPGTYSFVCGQHGFMTGEVQVGAVSTPTATATGTATATPTPTASPIPTASPTPVATAAATAAPTTSAPPTMTTTTPVASGPAASALKLAKSQKGPAVKGSVAVARAGSRVVVELFAKPSALGRKGKTPVKVGSAIKTAAAGTASFTINLNRAAKKVLRTKGKLALTAKVTVTPASGAPFSQTLTVTLKR